MTIWAISEKELGETVESCSEHSRQVLSVNYYADVLIDYIREIRRQRLLIKSLQKKCRRYEGIIKDEQSSWKPLTHRDKDNFLSGNQDRFQDKE